MAPWLAAEIPVLIEEGKIKKDWLCIIKLIMSKMNLRLWNNLKKTQFILNLS